MLDKTISQHALFDTLNSIFTYQFSAEFATIFLKTFPEMTFEWSKRTKKLKHIYLGTELQASYRPTTGTFTLALGGIQRILPDLPFPLFRIQVQSEVSEFIREGKSVFSKHVVLAYPKLKVGDEVIIVNEADQLLAIGKLVLPVNHIRYFTNGIAVKNRKGSKSIKSI